MNNFEYFKNGKVLFTVDTSTEEYKNALKGTGFEDLDNYDKEKCTKKCINNLTKKNYYHPLDYIPNSIINSNIAEYAFNKDIDNYPFIPNCFKTETMSDIAMTQGRNKLFNLATTPDRLIKPEYYNIDFDEDNFIEAYSYNPNFKYGDFQKYIKNYNADEFYRNLCLNYNEELIFNPIEEFITNDFISKLKEINIEDILSLLPQNFITQDIVDSFINFIYNNEIDPRMFHKIKIDNELLNYKQLDDLISKNPYAICIFDKSMLNDDLIIKAIDSNIPIYIIDSIDIDTTFIRSLEYLKYYLLNKNYDDYILVPSILSNDFEFLASLYNKNYKNNSLNIDKKNRMILNYINIEAVNLMTEEFRIDPISLLESKYCDKVSKEYIVKYYNHISGFDSSELVLLLEIQSKDDLIYIINNTNDRFLEDLSYHLISYENNSLVFNDPDIIKCVNNTLIKRNLFSDFNINHILEQNPDLVYKLIEEKNHNISFINHKFFNEEIFLKLKEYCFDFNKLWLSKDCLHILKYYPQYFSYDDLLYYLKSAPNNIGYFTIEFINPSYLTKEVLDIIFSEKFIDSYYYNLNILGKI